MTSPQPLTAKVKGSFAYLTVKDRLPIILTKVIDHLCREKSTICAEYGDVTEEIKFVVSQLSQLKNELQTNKPLRPFPLQSENVQSNDNEIWNKEIDAFQIQHDSPPKWFTASWLFVECYFYKSIHEAFLSTKSLKNYDPFYDQKIQSCTGAIESIKILCTFLRKEVICSSNRNLNTDKDLLIDMVEISLWGNQCDLSISGGSQLLQENNSLAKLKGSRNNIIASDVEAFWDFLQKHREGKRHHMAIILDNSGLELIADLCLASVLIDLKFASSITFYIKSRPWFVSDTTAVDFNWILNFLRDGGGDMKEMSLKFVDYLKTGSWMIKEHSFWTGPFDFARMKKVDRALYNELNQYSLLIFKGDLNYRKLVGDLDWPNGTDLRKAVRGFLPASMLILRTIKGGPVVGLDEASAAVEDLKSKDNWATSGEVGMIQFISNQSYFKFISILTVSTLSMLLISLLFKLFWF